MAEDRLFDRRCRLVFSTPSEGDFHSTSRDELEITGDDRGVGNRVVFKIDLTIKKEPSTSEIQIYNLAESSRALIQKKPAKCVLEAGYDETEMARLFVGDVRIADSKKAGADYITVVKLGDGERAWQEARVKESFGAGTNAGDVLRYLANASGLQLGNVPDKIAEITKTYDQGYSVNGYWRDEMKKFCDSIGYEFSVQNQALQVLLPGQSINADGLIPEISVESGLVDTPEIGTPEKKGKPFTIQFKALIRATRIGALVRLKSKAHDGNVLVTKASYSGDTMGGEWYVNYVGTIQK